MQGNSFISIFPQAQQRVLKAGTGHRHVHFPRWQADELIAQCHETLQGCLQISGLITQRHASIHLRHAPAISDIIIAGRVRVCRRTHRPNALRQPRLRLSDRCSIGGVFGAVDNEIVRSRTSLAPLSGYFI